MLWLCVRLPPLERAARLRLAVWAQQWSSWTSLGADDDDALTEVQPDEAASWLWLEIGASLKIFGGHGALRAQVAAALEPLGLAAHTAIAPTPQAARLLTAVREPRVVTTPEALEARLAPLRLELLALPASARAALRSAGFRRIGEVLALTDGALAQRFGPQAALYLQRLRGMAREPMPAVSFPERYAGRADFDGEVHEAPALLFPLQRLLWELQGYLRAADRALQRCELRFTHRGHADSELLLHSSLPSREAAHWLALARERLGDLVLPAPVRALQLLASEFVAPAVGQRDFFASEAEQAQALHEVLDRLRARLGVDSIRRLQPHRDYRPERAWQARPMTASAPDPSPACDDAPRPCWLLHAPRPLEAPPLLVTGPERIESGWWDHGDVARDYYLARDAAGTRLWVYQDLRGGGWFLHGLWA
jgi:protein ImuB